MAKTTQKKCFSLVANLHGGLNNPVSVIFLFFLQALSSPHTSTTSSYIQFDASISAHDDLLNIQVYTVYSHTDKYKPYHSHSQAQWVWLPLFVLFIGRCLADMYIYTYIYTSHSLFGDYYSNDYGFGFDYG